MANYFSTPQLVTLTGDYDDPSFLGRRRRRGRLRARIRARIEARRARRRARRARRIEARRLRKMGVKFSDPRRKAIRRARRKARRARRRRIFKRIGFRFLPLPVKMAILARKRRRARIAAKRGNFTSRAFRRSPVAARNFPPSPVSASDYKPAPVTAWHARRYFKGDGTKFKRFLSKLSYDTKEGTVKYVPGKGLTLTTPQEKIPPQTGIFKQGAGAIFTQKNMIPLLIGGGVLLYVFSQRNRGIVNGGK